MTKRHIIAAIALATLAATSYASSPVWLEADSAEAIRSRMANDFSLTLEQGRQAINKRYGTDYTLDDMRLIAWPTKWEVARKRHRACPWCNFHWFRCSNLLTKACSPLNAL